MLGGWRCSKVEAELLPPGCGMGDVGGNKDGREYGSMGDGVEWERNERVKGRTWMTAEWGGTQVGQVLAIEVVSVTEENSRRGSRPLSFRCRGQAFWELWTCFFSQTVINPYTY